MYKMSNGLSFNGFAIVFSGILLTLSISCEDTSTTGRLNSRKKPFVVMAKSDPYNNKSSCNVTLKDADGTFFNIYDCDFCRDYNLKDTIK